MRKQTTSIGDESNAAGNPFEEAGTNNTTSLPLSDEPTGTQHSFPIIGIGASAGGLEALESSSPTCPCAAVWPS